MMGNKAPTVPGTVAGLAKTLELYGTMELKKLMAPAIKIAEEGFEVGWWTVSHIVGIMEQFSRFPAWRKLFLKEEKYPLRLYSRFVKIPPDMLVNKDMIKSLRLITEEGADAFYKGRSPKI